MDMLELLHDHAKHMEWIPEGGNETDGTSSSTQDKHRDLIDMRKTINEDEDDPVVRVSRF